MHLAGRSHRHLILPRLSSLESHPPSLCSGCSDLMATSAIVAKSQTHRILTQGGAREGSTVSIQHFTTST
ncbi:hypothetical protein FJTKL_12548 [Diaporthe vaccinii]|uniref:Uncharacterized protein n=1 Tax=Diaporthe vaccinii TaxID=105482 RepID=A0ABR4EDS8_9PEZI